MNQKAENFDLGFQKEKNYSFNLYGHSVPFQHTIFINVNSK